MQELKKNINQYKEKQKETREKIKSQLIKMGEHIASNEELHSDDIALTENIEELRQLRKIIPEKNSEVHNISRLDSELKSVRNQNKEKKTDLNDKEKEIQVHYKSVGEAALQVYQENPDENQGYQPIFSEILEITGQLELSETELTTLARQKEKENFFQKLFSSAKTVFKEGKHKGLVQKKNSLYTRIGKQILESEFVKENDSYLLNEIVHPLEDVMSDIKSIQAEITSFEETENVLVEQLSAMGVKGSAEQRNKEIEKEIKEIQENIKEKCLALGKIYIKNRNQIENPPADINDIFIEVDHLDGEYETYEVEIEKFNKEIEILKIEDKLDKNQKHITAQKNKIQKLSDEISRLETENQHLENDKQKLKDEIIKG